MIDLTPEIWNTEDGTPIYMYSMHQLEHFQHKLREDYALKRRRLSGAEREMNRLACSTPKKGLGAE